MRKGLGICGTGCSVGRSKNPVEAGNSNSCGCRELTRTKITALGLRLADRRVSGGEQEEEYGMFTGIRRWERSWRVAKGTHSAVLTIAGGKVLEDVHIGDSIAVNGVCLTITFADVGIYRRP